MAPVIRFLPPIGKMWIAFPSVRFGLDLAQAVADAWVAN